MLPNTGHYKYNARQQWQCSMLIHTLYNNKEGEREKKDWLIDHASIDHIDDLSFYWLFAYIICIVGASTELSRFVLYLPTSNVTQ